MKLKALKTFRLGANNYKRGSSLELADAKAKDMIDRGYAEAAKVAKPTGNEEPKKAAPKKAAD